MTILAVASMVTACSIDPRAFAGGTGGGTGQLGGGGGSGGPCISDAECDDQNRCTSDQCSADGKCVYTPNNVTPDDKNDCTVDSCEGSKERHDPAADGTPCGAGGKLTCKGAACAGCLEDADCGTSDPCVTYHCDSVALVCEDTKAPAGTLVDLGNPSDCQKSVCDGNGSVITVADAADSPVGDGNLCRRYGCDGATPINGDPEPPTKECVAASCADATHEQPQSFCDGNGTCLSQAVKQCNPEYICEANVCRIDCFDDTDCGSAAFCQSSACVADFSSGAPCVGNNQCLTGFCVDGLCCESACDGTCQSCNFGEPGKCIFLPSGVQDDTCAQSQRCDSSHLCQDLGPGSPIGGPCNSNNDCGSGNSCRDEFCKLPVGAACNPGNAWLCASNLCISFLCTPCVSYADCPDNASCSAGACRLPNGQPCNSSTSCESNRCVDNVCCDTTCNHGCDACVADLKESGTDSGTCGPAKANLPHGFCASPYKCDGTGQCCDANGMNCN